MQEKYNEPRYNFKQEWSPLQGQHIDVFKLLFWQSTCFFCEVHPPPPQRRSCRCNFKHGTCPTTGSEEVWYSWDMETVPQNAWCWPPDQNHQDNKVNNTWQAHVQKKKYKMATETSGGFFPCSQSMHHFPLHSTWCTPSPGVSYSSEKWCKMATETSGVFPPCLTNVCTTFHYIPHGAHHPQVFMPPLQGPLKYWQVLQRSVPFKLIGADGVTLHLSKWMCRLVAVPFSSSSLLIHV